MPRSCRPFDVGVAVAIGASIVGCLPNSNNQPTAANPNPTPAQPAVQEKPIVAPHNGAKPSDPLRMRIEAALESVHRRDLLTTNSFWTIFHGILGMGPGATLKEPGTNNRYNALDYIFSERGGNIRGLAFVPTTVGKEVGLDVITVGKDPFLKEHEAQGHQDQFVAEMIQWGVSPNREIKIAGLPDRTFKFQDFVTESKARARVDQDQELGWCLIVVAEYGGGTEAEWTNRFGQKLKFEQMLEYEMKADMNIAACGGTHRLFGVAWAYHRHAAHCKKHDKAMSDVWKRAKEYLEKYKNLSHEWQAPDGVFSTGYYREKQYAPEIEPRMATSGHILEWLAQYVTDEEIRSEWMEKGARSLSQVILDSDRVPVASGSLYHAAHGLAVYHERRYGKEEGQGAGAKGQVGQR
jgi:hypothetical protein